MGQRTCSISECDRPVRAWGFCDGHYRRWRKGDLRADEPLGDFSGRNPRLCSVPGCDKKHFCKGYCEAHDRRARRGDPLDVPLRIHAPRGAQVGCSVEDCESPHYAKGFCRAHWGVWRREQRSPERQEADRLRDRIWKEANRPKSRAYVSKSGAQRRAAVRLPFTAEQVVERMAYWGNRCWICSGDFEAIDHVKPLAKGGWHALMNLRPICRSCNSRKHARWPVTPALLDAIRGRRTADFAA